MTERTHVAFSGK